MHLGLIDGPFVLISTQESPVPLPKFQMAPRLKILMASGSKKTTQIYFSYLSKVLANKAPPGCPTGPLRRERGLPTGHFAYLSKTTFFGFPSKEALPQGPLMESLAEKYPTTTARLHSSIKVPGIHAPHTQSSTRLERGPHGERCPHPETFLTYLPGSPVKALPSGPPRSHFQESDTSAT